MGAFSRYVSSYTSCKDQRKMPGVFLYYCLPYCLIIGSFVEAHRLVKLVCQWVPGICCLHPHPPVLGLWACAAMPGFLCGYRRFKLKPSCLHSKSSYRLRYLPSSKKIHHPHFKKLISCIESELCRSKRRNKASWKLWQSRDVDQ